MPEDSNYRMPNWAELESEYPTPNFPTRLDGEEWLPKTDWSRDGIIANED